MRYPCLHPELTKQDIKSIMMLSLRPILPVAQYIFILLGVLVSFNIAATPVNKPNISIADLNKIDQQHQQFSSHFFQQFVKSQGKQLVLFKGVKQLEKAVQDYTSTSRDIVASGLIIKNIPMLKNNYNNLAIYSFIKHLLEQNEWVSANAIYEILQQEGDHILSATASYLFAEYYFHRQRSDEVLAELKNAINNLPANEAHHAILMKGISLQRSEEHRKALVEYAKIPPASERYVSARLNMAIANIRQGWWSDGHINLTEALAHPVAKKQEEHINRLYLTMGYSFLNQEYYRNSREAFRNVGLNSEYTDQALLGIALTAANQEDYIGALNAVKILKEKKSRELPVDESYLLIPYFYERLKQNTTATAGYTEAISYYQGRIAEIQDVLTKGILFNSSSFQLEPVISITLGQNRIVLTTDYPDYFIKNYIKLGTYRAYLDKMSNQGLNAEYQRLVKAYESHIARMIEIVLHNRIEHLNSYMDQARFGVARLYDSNIGPK